MPMLSLSGSPANDNTYQGCLYFMWTDTGYFKIGVAKDPEDRRRTLQTGCPVKIHLGGCFETHPFGFSPYALEKTMHKFFAHQKVHGEWFFDATRIGAKCGDKYPHGIDPFKLAWAYHQYPYLYDAWYRRQTG